MTRRDAASSFFGEDNVRQSVLPYLDPYIFLFAGGMGIAAAMQQWNLHRRIALGIMDRVGTDPRRLLAECGRVAAQVDLQVDRPAPSFSEWITGLRGPFFFSRIILSVGSLTALSSTSPGPLSTYSL